MKRNFVCLRKECGSNGSHMMRTSPVHAYCYMGDEDDDTKDEDDYTCFYDDHETYGVAY